MLIMSTRAADPVEAKRAALLEAAKEAFSRYGYRRTSMADVAAIARVSRPALYLHFRDKADLFRALARALTDAALEAAEAAWPKGAGFAEGFAAAALAKDLEFFRLIHLSPHGAEIVDAHAALTQDLHDEIEARFSRLVAARAGGGRAARTLGLALARALEGLKRGAKDEAEFIATVRALAAAAGSAFAT